MSDHSKPTPDVAAVIKELRRYLLEKGHRFERGPTYESQDKPLSNVVQAARMYEGLGYVKLMQVGNPPVYALLERGHQEMHIFQPQDPQVRAWLEDDQLVLNNPTVRTHLAQSAGLSESEIPVADHPKRFHITEIGDVYIITSENTPPERG